MLLTPTIVRKSRWVELCLSQCLFPSIQMWLWALQIFLSSKKCVLSYSEFGCEQTFYTTWKWYIEVCIISFPNQSIPHSGERWCVQYVVIRPSELEHPQALEWFCGLWHNWSAAPSQDMGIVEKWCEKMLDHLLDHPHEMLVSYLNCAHPWQSVPIPVVLQLVAVGQDRAHSFVDRSLHLLFVICFSPDCELYWQSLEFLPWKIRTCYHFLD